LAVTAIPVLEPRLCAFQKCPRVDGLRPVLAIF
jgi:hypothetical protein